MIYEKGDISPYINDYKECLRILEEKKGGDSVLLDIREVNSYLDYFLISSGNSHVHCRALAKELERFLLSKGLKKLNNPDMESGWIILDYSDLIIHIFTEEMREFYQLERLWGDALKIQ